MTFLYATYARRRTEAESPDTRISRYVSLTYILYTETEPGKRERLPNALLAEMSWKGKSKIAVYPSSPTLGK